MNTNWIAPTSDVIVGLSAIFVAIIALLGLRIWRKELIGKAKFDAAHNVLLLARKVTEDFEGARFVMTWAGESADRIREETESPEVARVLDEAHARNKRLKPLSENLQKLQQAAWEAEIILGEDASKSISEAMEDYRKCYAELSVDVTDTRYAR